MNARLAARSNLDPSTRVFRAFIGLELAGAAGFTLILFTALLAPKVKRYPTWYSFCISWVLSGISYSLLALAGEQDNPEPKHSLCLAQAASIYAAPVLTGATTCALSIQMFLTTRSIVTRDDRYKPNQTLSMALLAIPYWLWMIMFAATLAYGLLHPSDVMRSLNWNYCDLRTVTPSKAASLICVITTVLSILIQIFIVRLLIKNRTIIAGSVHSLAMAFRVMLFTFLGTVGFMVSVVYVVTWKRGAEFDIVLAIIPVSALLIFGTQMDLLRAWMFWNW